MRAHEFITEAPLASYDLLGDFSDDGKRKANPFNPVDRRLVSHPVTKLKTQDFFKQSPYNFRIFMSNLPGHRKERESGEASTEKIKAMYGSHAEKINSGREDAITVVFLGNYGEARVPLTPWTMAHRIGHTIQMTRNYVGGRNDTAWHRLEEQFFSQINALLTNIYKQDFKFDPSTMNRNAFRWSWRPQYAALFNAIGTQRSSRRELIRRPYEFLYELFAQYILTGGVKLNPVPLQLPYGRKAWGHPTRYMSYRMDARDEDTRQQISDKIAASLVPLFDRVLSDAVGKIYLM